MAIDPCTKRSYASRVRYAPRYLQRCSRALAEALEGAPAYESWRRLDPGPAAGVFERFACLPALTKRELRVFGPRGFVARGRDVDAALAAGEIVIVHTSGSTSDRVANAWFQPWWNASEEASWRLNAHSRAAAVGEHPEAILTSPWCTGIPCEDDYLSMKERTVGRFLYLSERSDPSAWTDELMNRMAAELDSFRPVVLEANPSFLAKLSRHITARKLRVRSPSLIILTYENPSILHRRQIARAFDAPVASSYGATEAGYVFMECEAGRLHQVTESCHVDFLPFAPEHGGPDVGRVLVTTFDNPWRSLMRFDIGDVVRLDGRTPCPCGRSEGLTAESIEGRAISLTLTPDGRAVTQGAVDRALADLEGLAEYRLRQKGESSYELHVVIEETGGGEPADPDRVSGAAAARVSGAAAEALRALYGADAAIEVRRVRGIAPDPPGKYLLTRRFEPVDPDSLLDRSYAPRSSREACE